MPQVHDARYDEGDDLPQQSWLCHAKLLIGVETNHIIHVTTSKLGVDRKVDVTGRADCYCRQAPYAECLSTTMPDTT